MFSIITCRYKKEFRVSNAHIGETLTDFPVSFRLDNAEIISVLSSSAYRKKLAICPKDTTLQCPIHIVFWDTDRAWIRFKALSLSASADTAFEIYYDNQEDDNTDYVGDTGDTVSHDVYDSDFEAIWDMNTVPPADTPDALGNYPLYTSGGMTADDLITDPDIGRCLTFDGVDDRLRNGSDILNRGTGDPYTVIMMARPDTVTNDRYFWYKYTGSLAIIKNSKIEIRNGAAISDDVITAGEWYFIGDRRKADGEIRLFVDDDKFGSSTSAENFDNDQSFTIASDAWSAYLNVTINFCSVSTIARSDAWISAFYHGLNNDLIYYPQPTGDNAISLSPGMASVLNWGKWFRENKSRCTVRYFFRIDDMYFPISSFQCRETLTAKAYVSAVIPNASEYSDAIIARSGGTMVVEMAYFFIESEQLRQEIARAPISDISVDMGSDNQSVSLTAHRNIVSAQKTVILEKPTYTDLAGGKRTYRFPKPDMFLHAGDTAIVDGVSFTVQSISYSVSPSQQSMTISGS